MERKAQTPHFVFVVQFDIIVAFIAIRTCVCQAIGVYVCVLAHKPQFSRHTRHVSCDLSHRCRESCAEGIGTCHWFTYIYVWLFCLTFYSYLKFKLFPTLCWETGCSTQSIYLYLCCFWRDKLYKDTFSFLFLTICVSISKRVFVSIVTKREYPHLPEGCSRDRRSVSSSQLPLLEIQISHTSSQR